ncbi:MAG: hypothetical protein AAF968_10210 [Pseudomonadota bacterium]
MRRVLGTAYARGDGLHEVSIRYGDGYVFTGISEGEAAAWSSVKELIGFFRSANAHQIHKAAATLASDAKIARERGNPHAQRLATNALYMREFAEDLTIAVCREHVGDAS